MAERWMQKVKAGIEKRGTKGALNESASRAGKSKSEYCANPPTGRAGRRCGLWKAFKGARKGRKGGR